MLKPKFTKEDVYKYLSIPNEEELKFYINACNNDLYDGPRNIIPGDKYPWKGFLGGCGRIKEIFLNQNLPEEIYYDNNAGIFMDSLPKFDEIDDSLEFYSVDVKKTLAGQELSPYIR